MKYIPIESLAFLTVPMREPFLAYTSKTTVQNPHQVDDFYTYGNVDDLPKYLKKAQTLSTKLDLCREKIQQFNMEENAFGWEKTEYPLWQVRELGVT